MSLADSIGREVANAALDSSIGRCLEYVRRGIQRAKGKPEKPVRIESAKDAGPWLEKQGFVQIYSSNYRNGDVMIIQANSKHIHGHIQVYYNQKWYSDFKQKTSNPWVNCSVKAVYRYTPEPTKTYNSYHPDEQDNSYSITDEPRKSYSFSSSFSGYSTNYLPSSSSSYSPYSGYSGSSGLGGLGGLGFGSSNQPTKTYNSYHPDEQDNQYSITDEPRNSYSFSSSFSGYSGSSGLGGLGFGSSNQSIESNTKNFINMMTRGRKY